MAPLRGLRRPGYLANRRLPCLLGAVAVLWGACVPASHAQALSGPERVHSVWNALGQTRAELPASASAQPLPRAAPQALAVEHREAADRLLAGPGTVALLLLDRGRVVFEGYAQGATESDRLLSYSIAKSMTALAVGEALCAGRLRSLDDRAQSHAPELTGTAYGEATVRDLLRMASGAKAGTAALHGQPRAGATAALTRGQGSVRELLQEFGARDRALFGLVPPGQRFSYNNLDTDALARVVQGAVGEPFVAWFGRTVLARAAPEQSSFWALDAQGDVIAHAFYMATLRDWGRLAQGTLDLWKGRTGTGCLQQFVRDATSRQIATFHRDGFQGYGYQIWRDERMLPVESFWMLGFGGQRIGIDPVTERILITFAWQPQAEAFELFRRWARP